MWRCRERCGGKKGIKPDHIPPLGFTDPFFLHLFKSEEAAEAQGSKEEDMAGKSGNWQAGAGRGGPGGRDNFSSGRSNSPPGRNFGRFDDRNEGCGDRREGGGNFRFGDVAGRAVVETDCITASKEGMDMRKEEQRDLGVLEETKADLNIRTEERADLGSLFLDREKVSHITIKKRAIMGTE